MGGDCLASAPQVALGRGYLAELKRRGAVAMPMCAVHAADSVTGDGRRLVACGYGDVVGA
jgi:hypothetical protein